MVVIGDPIISAIIEKLVDLGLDYISDQLERQTGMKDELGRLKDALPRIQSVVYAAENAGHQHITDPSLKAWLWQLKHAVYAADDVLDDLEYLRLEQQVQSDTYTSENNKVHTLFFHCKQKVVEFGKRVLKSDPTLKKLREVVKRLDEVAAHVGNFLSLVANTHQQHQHHQSYIDSSRETGPLLTESIVLGRDEERVKLMQWLMDESIPSVSLFSVVGHGGIGKTTLAQFIFNDESVQESFHLKIWVCVSNRFDVKRLTAAILESAIEERPKFDSLAALQGALKNKLMSSKKFLLVLDDAWNEDNVTSWDKLLAPLRFGHKGSKILLTTRLNRVGELAAKALGGEQRSIKLESLKMGDFIVLFNQYAFAGVNSDEYNKLQSIGMHIARRLGGFPLAAKTIGALLNSNLDDMHWSDILHTGISIHMQQNDDNIMPVLMLSYHHLPMHLRPCFAYCSIFPQDYKFVKRDLVRMWIAAGVIQYSLPNRRESLEDIGARYFDDLVRRSFLESSPEFNNQACYVMHDLLHDLAQSVAHNECFCFVCGKSLENIPSTVRHLYFETDDLNHIEKIESWKNLRTLIFVFEGYVPNSANVIEKAFKSFIGIRVLLITVDNMEVLPEAIGDMKHLRYLSVHHRILQLPKSLCRLYHLQVIALEFFDLCFVYPKGMKNLISLRHLVGGDIVYEIDEIGKLTSLQELQFIVEEECGYKIRELKNLRELHVLEIDCLENVKCIEEASMAELHNKMHLHTLDLKWNFKGSVTLSEHEQILDCLRPCSSIKKLTIRGYIGVKSANWMEAEYIENLEYIELVNCPGWEHLPSFDKLHCLKYLYMANMPAVKQLDLGAMIQEIKIRDCPELEVLPSLPLSLKELELENVRVTGLANSSSSFSSLSSLKITKCKKLISLAKGLLQGYIISLKYLDISDCKELIDLPAEGLQHLSSLRTLVFKNCPKLQLFRSTSRSEDNQYDNFLPSSLQSLCIGNCGEFDRSLPALLQGSFPCLSTLELYNCNDMTVFPSQDVWRRLTSLTDLCIKNCEKLKSVESLKALRHLCFLTIVRCPNLVPTAELIKEEEFALSVDYLRIDDPFLLLIQPLRNLASVRELIMWDCRHLVSMDGEMESWLSQNGTDLEELTMFGAVSLQSLPKLPSSLKKLLIIDSNKTLKKRCEKNEGADWPNIEHIPNIII